MYFQTVWEKILFVTQQVGSSNFLLKFFHFFAQGNQFFLREDEESLQLESISQRGGKRGG